MKKKPAIKSRLRFWLWSALFVGYSAAVAGVMIDAIGDNYRELSTVAETTTEAAPEQRQLGAAQVAALYRAQSATPLVSLPPGSTFRVVWPDGSSEVVRIVSQADAQGVEVVDGSQRDAAGLPLGQAELQVQPVSTETPRRDPSAMAEAFRD
ncbi:hypothetical protein LDO26_14160 [Luteimonas sp. BDR2-5]|uniref:hypothetical protein n=1 Tax=Proluteimonas luteida TaxID=2878685 RepID=UPI001E3015CB|nr:hypothetical protein [Luteimonas sp. BDR2-5]MCD9029341.1 hypothetical protein [Luteimonas sp. BDR2-5]